jgi:hypothetical protein
MQSPVISSDTQSAVRDMVILSGQNRETLNLYALVDESVFQTFHLDDPWSDYDVKNIDFSLLQDIAINPEADEQEIRQKCSKSWAGEIDAFLFHLKTIFFYGKNKKRQFQTFKLFQSRVELDSWLNNNSDIVIKGEYPEL